MKGNSRMCIQKKNKRCDDYLVLCATIGDLNAGAEIFCDRLKGHKGKHSGLVMMESTDGRGRHYDVKIWWEDK